MLIGSAHVQVLSGVPWRELVALEKCGRFPRRVAAEGVWRESDVRAWLAARLPGRESYTVHAVRADGRGLIVQLGPYDFVIGWELVNRCVAEHEESGK